MNERNNIPANDGDLERPWYHDGLKFKCTQCGQCCTGAPGVVWTTEEELRAIADYLNISVGELRVHHTRLVGRRVSLTEYANGDCTFFDPQSRKCRVYPVRPTQCQTWPFWPSNIATPENWEEVKEVCPGSGQGDFYSLDKIEDQARRLKI